MTTDELLREASDPTTPGERLRELAFTAESLDVCEAATRNPSLPLPWLSLRLRTTPSPGRNLTVHLAAWNNPAVQALLMREPLPSYEQAALRTLQRVSTSESYYAPERTQTIAEAVALWAERRHLVGYSEARDLTRRLAEVFGLPWPEP